MHLSQIIKQKNYEQIVHRLRRHPITFVPIGLLFIILMCVPAVAYFIIHSLFPAVFEHQVLYPLLVILASIYYLSMYLFLYVQFIDYYLDLWIVTNDRIVDMEQFGLFTRTTTELDLFRIQDVTAEVHGIFPTIFNYGNIHIKTASANVDIVFHNVPGPNKIREDLLKLSDADRKYHYKTDKEENS